MDRETFEKKKPFAGEKKPSMKRRGINHDYTRRGTYLLTLVVEGRLPLLATVSGTSSEPRVTLTALGTSVRDEWLGVSRYYPQVKCIGLQVMPDHLHAILLVKEQLPCHLSTVVRGIKTGCGRAYRRLFPTYAAIESQHTKAETQQTSGSHPKHGLLFEPGYNDRFLKEEGQLERWKNYLAENPRRLLMKREHPDLFRVQRGLEAAGISFSAIGNRFLLQRPERLQVQCSRRLTEAEIAERVDYFLKAAAEGAVLVSPAISPGEKAVMRAAFERGYPLVLLQENGFTDLAKPGGQRMEACARGQLLILAPWEHHNEQTTIRRDQCLQLNDMAAALCD